MKIVQVNTTPRKAVMIPSASSAATISTHDIVYLKVKLIQLFTQTLCHDFVNKPGSYNFHRTKHVHSWNLPVLLHFIILSDSFELFVYISALAVSD